MRSAILALVLALAASPACAQSDANRSICAASDDSAYSAEQRIAACSAVIAASAGSPKPVAQALVDRGRAEWYASRMKPAFADLDRAIALDPANSSAFRERSNAFRSTHALDRALADAAEAVRLDSKDALAFDNRGNVFAEKGEYDRALRDYDAAVRLDPNLALARRDARRRLLP